MKPGQRINSDNKREEGAGLSVALRAVAERLKGRSPAGKFIKACGRAADSLPAGLKPLPRVVFFKVVSGHFAFAVRAEHAGAVVFVHTRFRWDRQGV